MPAHNPQRINFSSDGGVEESASVCSAIRRQFMEHHGPVVWMPKESEILEEIACIGQQEVTGGNGGRGQP
jgi:hypothetical protein